MPDMENEQFCPPQINIPPTFPFVLKQYAKAAIKTQPYDLVRWSAAYFRALAHGETPPAKDRLEFPPLETPSGLTPGYLHVLIKQLGKEGTVTVEELREKWLAICLKEEGLYQMLKIGQFGATLDWLCFIGVAAGFLTSSLEETMVLVCELLTEESAGGLASIPLQAFSKVYSYLAALDCNSQDTRHTAGKPTKSEDKKEMWGSDSDSVSSAAVSTDSAQQLYMAVGSASRSPQLSRVPSELDTSVPADAADAADTPVRRSGTSTTTLTPEQSDREDDGAMLQTFYDNTSTLRDSPQSSEEAIAGRNKIIVEDTPNQDNDKETHHLAANSSAPEMKRSQARSSDGGMLKKVSSLDETRVEARWTGDSSKPGTESKSAPLCVPGIGPVVEPAHVATVVSYLAEIAAEQNGMINPTNFCHYMCPPLQGHIVSSSPESYKT